MSSPPTRSAPTPWGGAIANTEGVVIQNGATKNTISANLISGSGEGVHSGGRHGTYPDGNKIGTGCRRAPWPF